MLIRPAGDADLPGILAIYNDAVAGTTAIWNDAPVDLVNRRQWLADRQVRGYPVLVAVDAATGGTDVLGYASFGDFRPFDGYRITVEHSVYVATEARRRGIGRALVAALPPLARACGKRVMIGGIEGGNAASLALHAGLGFVETGRLAGVGTKFGRRLDLVFMQLEL